MRNNLNADRVRRHMARSTPDTIEFRVDLITDAGQLRYQKDLRRWALKMQIKHDDNNMKIDLFRDDLLARFPGETVIKARYVPSFAPHSSETVDAPPFRIASAQKLTSHFQVRKEDLDFTPPSDFDWYRRG